MTCHTCTQLTKDSRRYQPSSGVWWGMQFGERRAEKQGHTKRICFEHGCDPQTHQDDTNHTRRRTMHMLSSQKTPEGTGAWWGVQLGGRREHIAHGKRRSHTTTALEHGTKSDVLKGNRAPVFYIDNVRGGFSQVEVDAWGQKASNSTEFHRATRGRKRGIPESRL